MNARRRTILVFNQPPEGEAERFSVSRYAVGDLFPGAWNKDEQPDQWRRLAELIDELDPAQIGVNMSPTFALADGLSVAEHDALRKALAQPARDRLVNADNLAIGYLETRTPTELEIYPGIVRIAHTILAEGLSTSAIEPGVTTTADLEWWFRERVLELGLGTWFHPSASVQRNATSHSGSFADESGVQTIQRGDLVHVDFGITYLGLNTDTQWHAYVLREGEREPPAGLVAGLAAGNRLQDILMGEFEAGRTGNEILASALEKAREEGLKPTIYTHPLGLHGHAAGPTIGLWDQQGGVPGPGDYPLNPSTCYAVELAAAVEIPEWADQEIRIMLEEDAFYDGRTCRFLDGRQTRLALIP